MTCNFFPQPHMYQSCMPHCMSNPYHYPAGNTVIVNTCCPKEKPPLDLSKLIMAVNEKSNLINAITGDDSGLKQKECIETLKKAKGDLSISGGKIVGQCDDTKSCAECMKAVNESLSGMKSNYFLPLEMSTQGISNDDIL